MARPASRYPTELELQVLQILWQAGESSAMSVRDALAEECDRDLARTSVVTTLNVMADKGLVDRRPQGRAFLFSPAVSREEVSQGMLGDLLDRVFEGSAEALLLNLLDSEHVDDDDHQALRRLINRKRRGGKQ
ncbi:Methicillin resistance regulatory protein MecI [Posidoniimonas polymericola]|uniref:Methicillin resistance regulatory protein MecI n=1 Tax=Posidoniimonas polymericola TaxID=2528002 RepID=A0A5C5ZF42_9BACT|nr:BlaI/MecI/CopY family transcriptional regulator [Posidoniimonas polymericola]TWT85461.1 Methicillin resistance regulatory protein MecI [Posidoniimonas polymericola]